MRPLCCVNEVQWKKDVQKAARKWLSHDKMSYEEAEIEYKQSVTKDFKCHVRKFGGCV